PAKDFLVNVSQLDAAGKPGEVSILLDEGLRVQDDGRIEILLRDLIIHGAAQLRLNCIIGETEIEADAGKLDSLAQVDPIPERVRSIRFLHHDERRLTGGEDRRFGRRMIWIVEQTRLNAAVARTGATLAVLDERLGDLIVAGLHQLLLDHVLYLLDVDKRLLGGMDPLGHGAGNRHRGRGVALEGQKCLPDRNLDLLLVPRYNLVVAADNAERGLRGNFPIDRYLAGAIQQQALGNEIGVVVDQGLLEKFIQRVEGEADRRMLARGLAEVGSH